MGPLELEEESVTNGLEEELTDAVQRFDALAAVKGAKAVSSSAARSTSSRVSAATLYQTRSCCDCSSGRRRSDIERRAGVRTDRGRRSKDRLILPENISANPRSLRAWVRKAVAYAGSQ